MTLLIGVSLHLCFLLEIQDPTYLVENCITQARTILGGSWMTASCNHNMLPRQRGKLQRSSKIDPYIIQLHDRSIIFDRCGILKHESGTTIRKGHSAVYATGISNAFSSEDAWEFMPTVGSIYSIDCQPTPSYDEVIASSRYREQI